MLLAVHSAEIAVGTSKHFANDRPQGRFPVGIHPSEYAPPSPLVQVRHEDRNVLCAMKQLSLRNVALFGATLEEQEAEVQSLSSEAQILSELNHPNIINYYESFQEEGSLYIVMELVRYLPRGQGGALTLERRSLVWARSSPFAAPRPSRWRMRDVRRSKHAHCSQPLVRHIGR
jgi:hypothetical protein